MMVTAQRFSDVDMAALKDIYSQTIGQMASAGHGELQFAEDLRQFFRVPNGKLYIWLADGIPVAALRCEPYRDGALISYLETAPAMRGRGYAKALVSSVAGCLAGEGMFKIYSHVNKRNKPSLSVHEFCGFQIFADYAKLLDGTVSQNYYTMLHENAAE